ncbi:VOC family protein [Streptomyces gobiensis]|uniref:VOC family protein n=1 Tax=Streptomyces gobiensis TaxID=2875706 RepID=UPI001E53E0B7|nr:VOC family protein [Streptomyces gobiensis]UGY92890.1 VOC family protein [Streptomyces gobiensis]
MSVQLNHAVVMSDDKEESAEFLATVLGLEFGVPFGSFRPVVVNDDLQLDFYDSPEPVQPTHYAFLVSEDEFTEIYSRIQQARIPYYADQNLQQPGEINRRDGGRGLYFEDPSKHLMEVLTRPYGSGGS